MNILVEPTDYAAQVVRFTDGDRDKADALFVASLKDDARFTKMPAIWNEAVRDAIGARGQL